MVEGTGLENRQAGNRLVGSNPTPSASLFIVDGRAFDRHDEAIGVSWLAMTVSKADGHV